MNVNESLLKRGFIEYPQDANPLYQRVINDALWMKCHLVANYGMLDSNLHLGIVHSSKLNAFELFEKTHIYIGVTDSLIKSYVDYFQNILKNNNVLSLLEKTLFIRIIPVTFEKDLWYGIDHKGQNYDKQHHGYVDVLSSLVRGCLDLVFFHELAHSFGEQGLLTGPVLLQGAALDPINNTVNESLADGDGTFWLIQHTLARLNEHSDLEVRMLQLILFLPLLGGLLGLMWSSELKKLPGPRSEKHPERLKRIKAYIHKISEQMDNREPGIFIKETLGFNISERLYELYNVAVKA